jgi:hypothetical protein
MPHPDHRSFEEREPPEQCQPRAGQSLAPCFTTRPRLGKTSFRPFITAALVGCLITQQWTVSAAPQASEEAVSEKKSSHGDDLYEPSVGQEGKNVIWVPTPDPLMQAMLEILKIQPNDILYDLGSGDGKIVIDAAQRYKIKAVGIEYNPDLVALARRHAVRAGVQDRATFIHGDIFIEDFSQASVLALYLLPDLNLKLKPTILAMRPGTRVVSNTFNMGSWPADATIELDSGNRAYYWVVPAKVQGRWQMDDARGDAIAELDLRQEFQLLQGTVRLNGETMPILSGRMLGETINLTYGPRAASGAQPQGTFQGSVEAGRLQGVLNDQTRQRPVTGSRLTSTHQARP